MAFVARQSGLALEAALGIKPGNPVGDLILRHSLLANQLFYIMIGFTVIGLLNVFLVSKRTADGVDGAAKQSAVLRIGLPILLVAAAARCAGLDCSRWRSRRTCRVESDRAASVLICDRGSSRSALVLLGYRVGRSVEVSWNSLSAM